MFTNSELGKIICRLALSLGLISLAVELAYLAYLRSDKRKKKLSLRKLNDDH